MLVCFCLATRVQWHILSLVMKFTGFPRCANLKAGGLWVHPEPAQGGVSRQQPADVQASAQGCRTGRQGSCPSGKTSLMFVLRVFPLLVFLRSCQRFMCAVRACKQHTTSRAFSLVLNDKETRFLQTPWKRCFQVSLLMLKLNS